ncbi:hypothetical protein ATY76_06370 [Rhizobium sp. R339]|uniref:hypothetical protein n=1 Tax=Rhizobium sp. R339 TaxID=1764273 RepID=UPI000B536C26|nr:hypothetical protein [Rhizobium sp. R339]OWV72446.1 hypothetical protein ATY76_06370 [Rhizobium sp. R339]
MKTPQRKFVVEFKSGRRQPKARTTSIWGDTDFKALAREVQDQSPHPFNATETAAESRDTLPEPLNQHPIGQIDAKAAEAAPSEPAQQQAAILIAEATVPAQESQPASKPAAASKRAPRRYSKREPATVASALTVEANPRPQFEAEDAPASKQDIAFLEAENKRLKSLRAEQLHAENLQLRTMLARFES